MSLGLLARLMGIDSGAPSSACWQFAEGAGAGRRGRESGSGGSGGGRRPRISWEWAEDALGSGICVWSSPEVGGCRVLGRLPDLRSLGRQVWVLAGPRPRRARPGRRGHPGLSGTTRLRHWETESNCRAGR